MEGTWERQRAHLGEQRETGPLVSVIVPTYNTEAFLDQALDSIEAQTLGDLEIICVNDGSSDSSGRIMAEHAARDSRIRIIEKPNGGYGSACNRGIDAAHGSWIAIVEPDDWIEPSMFEDMTAYASSFSCPVDLVKTPYWRIVDPDSPRQRKLNCSYRKRIHPDREPFDMRDPGAAHLLMHHPSIWSALYRTEFIRSLGIRFREIPGAGWADNPFLAETLCQARSIVYLDKPYYCYREESAEKAASLAQHNPLMPLERWHDMQDVIDRVGAGYETVLKSQIRRGFAYLDYLSGEADLEGDALKPEIVRMFRRMDANLVLTDAHLSPNWKSVYCREMGLPAPVGSKLPYVLSLASAALYSVANIGPRAMLELTATVMRRDKQQEGFAEAGDERAPVLAEAAVPPSPEPENSNALVSIIVPVYNSEEHLRACLESATAQRYETIEIICVDDGSTDSSHEIIEELAARDERICLVSQPNGGPSAARNRGMREARGDYILFLDSDDLLERDACSRIVHAFEEGTYDAVAFGWSCFPAQEANRWLANRMNVRDAVYPRFTDELLFSEMTQPYLRCALRRSFLAGHGLEFDESLSIGEDAQFLFAALARAQGVRLISDKLYRYRLPHEGSLMAAVRDDVSGKCLRDYLMMASIFQDWNRDATLEGHSKALVEWYVQFLLYTMLKQPLETRRQFIGLTRLLWLGYISEPTLRSLPLPKHAAALVRVVLEADDGGDLRIGEAQLEALLMNYRIREYGIADIAVTVKERLKGSA